MGPVLALELTVERWKEREESFMIRKEERERKERKERLRNSRKAHPMPLGDLSRSAGSVWAEAHQAALCGA
jgi:hypothetical protein